MTELDQALRPGSVVLDGPVRVEAEVVDCDRLGVTLRGIRVTGRVGSVAERAAALSGVENLPAPVQPIEVDPGLGGAVLRSAVRRRSYYEVRTDGREVSVDKFDIGNDGRERIPFTMTREQLGRMVEELGDVLR